MGSASAFFTQDSYNLGQIIHCDFTWSGGVYCADVGYTARLQITDSTGNIVYEQHISSATSCYASQDCHSTYLPTQIGTYYGRISVFDTANCQHIVNATDSCTVVSPQVTLTLVSTPSNGGTTHAVPPCCTYNSGDYIGVHAVASSGWWFDYWTDNHGNTFYSSEWNFYINSNTTCTAHFILATAYTLSVNNAPYDGGYIWNNYTNQSCTVTQCNYTNIPSGTVITISANTQAGWIFTGWTGDIGTCNPLNPTCDIVMNQSRTITANYSPIPTYTLTRAASGNGELPACYPACCTYTSETLVSLTASAWSGWHFDHWSGTDNNSINPTTVTMTSDKSVTVYYVSDTQDCADYLPFLFEFKVTDTSGATINTAEQGATVKLCARIARFDADPCARYNLSFYIDAVTQTGLIDTMTDDTYFSDATGGEWICVDWVIPMNQQTGYFTNFGVIETITAEDAEQAFTITAAPVETFVLTTSVTPEGAGTITLEPTGGEYSEGQQVTLTAVPTPSSDYIFDYWSGDITGETNPEYITMAGDKTVTAHFKLTTEVTCYGCNNNETTSASYPIGTICSKENTPNHPFPTYRNCSGGWTDYLIYAGIGLVATGAVIYLIRRKTTTKMGNGPQKPI